jgi:cytidylate kinase
MAAEERYDVVLEVALHPLSKCDFSDARAWAEALLQPGGPFQAPEEGMHCTPSACDSFGFANVYGARVYSITAPRENAPPPLFWQADVEVLLQRLNDGSSSSVLSALALDGEYLPADGDCAAEGHGAHGQPSQRAFSAMVLPSVRLYSLWPSLLFSESDSLKTRLLAYASTGLRLSQAGVDAHIVRWNRLVLLHGPPGTGKTSLSRALASKIALLQCESFPSGGVLMEVNAHNLFSRYFSESSKQVSQLFEQVNDVASDQSLLVCVLVDEVESLAHARRTSSSSEPSDALRVVNAVLTQLDSLRERPNVLVIATSNATEAVDDAFVDRADLKAYVGPPDARARHEILKTCVEELIRSGIVHMDPGSNDLPSDAQLSSHIASAALESDGMSGRALRRLPFLAAVECNVGTKGAGTSLHRYIDALRLAISKESADCERIGRG